MLKYLIGSWYAHNLMSFSSVLAPTIRHLCGDVDRPRLGGSMGLHVGPQAGLEVGLAPLDPQPGSAVESWRPSASLG